LVRLLREQITESKKEAVENSIPMSSGEFGRSITGVYIIVQLCDFLLILILPRSISFAIRRGWEFLRVWQGARNN